MNNSIVMDIILSLSLIFIYYIYTKFDKEIEVVNTRQMIALFIINMVILNIIKKVIWLLNSQSTFPSFAFRLSICPLSLWLTWKNTLADMEK